MAACSTLIGRMSLVGHLCAGNNERIRPDLVSSLSNQVTLAHLDLREGVVGRPRSEEVCPPRSIPIFSVYLPLIHHFGL